MTCTNPAILRTVRRGTGRAYDEGMEDNMDKTYTPEELTHLAQTLTQKEWDRLFPPRESEHEPFDASGYTGE